ncbi:MAG: putative Ig domain-containing protein [Nostoc sp.]|uniref:putative Ig domain-containing protein n=1 Tax=Nostoc sp. TaxID=1180 RepID=UPI002FF6191C
MGSPENGVTNGGLMPPSLLESASLSASLDDNSGLTELQKALKSSSSSSDPINSELGKPSLSNNPASIGDNQQSNPNQIANYTPSNGIFDNGLSITQPVVAKTTPLLKTSNNNQKSATTQSVDSLTGNTADASLLGISNPTTQISANSASAPLSVQTQQNTSQTDTLPFAIRTDGTISINGGGDFDGVPTDLTDDALIYAAKGFTINGNPTLPVQRNAQGNPIRDANGKLILIDRAVTVASGYTTINGTNNQYANLIPPQVVAQQTITVPAYADIKLVELNRRIPAGTPTVTFNISQNPINNANDWTNKFPPPGTTSNPKVVRVIGGGLNVPGNLSLSNYVITVDQGDINFNGNGQNFNNVVLIANNGNINLSNVQSRDLSVFASSSINMNAGARFAGYTTIANGSSSGNITFNGATTSTNTTDNLKVISAGDITYNGASDTRGLFLSVKNFTFNGSSTLYGSISAKGNIIFNGQATVIGVAELMPDITPPVISATLARDTAPFGQTNQDFITFDPTITGTVTDTNPILEFRAGFNNTPSANYISVIAQRNSDGSFSFTRSQLETINGGTLSDGIYTLHLQAKDLYGNLSDTFNLTFTLDTTTPSPNNLDLRTVDDSGSSNTDKITNKNTPSITGNAEAGAVVQLLNNGQLLGQATANNTGVWQIVTSNLTDGTYNLTATATDIAGNVSNVSAPIAIAIDSTLPLLTLNTPVDTAPLTPGARLTGRVDGTGSAVTALSYHFDNLASVTVPFNNATGAFDQSLNLTGLANGAHTLTITATDTAGNIKTTQYHVTVVIDQDAPVISASLLHDTAPNGQTNSDRITFDPTITGTVIDASRVVEFKAGFDNTLAVNFTNVTAFRNADGSFTFDRSQLETIYGGTLPDGFHTLHLQAVDEFHNTSNIFDFSFTFDSTTSEPIFNLNAVSDSGVVGDLHTFFDTVTLTGLAEANSTVVLEQTGAVTTSDNNGQFTFAHVSLAIGDNSLIARSTDIAGNQNTFSTNIYRFSPPTAINLAGNTVAENSSTGIVIGQLTSTDPDPGDTHTYTLEDNAGGRFRIVGNQLQVADGTLLNFESSTQHSVTITSTDANGLSLTKVFAIAVTNVNETPSFTSTPVSTSNSGSLYTYNIVAADPDAIESLRFTTNNLPSWLTLVDNLNGTAILSGTPRDFLSNINSNIHLSVTDASGLTAIQDFTIAPSLYEIEENNFTVFRSLPLLIPATPSILSFQINPQFDTTSVNSIHDAIDVALVDANGNSLVHTVASERDAFFNWTEGESTVFGAGASYDAATHTVSLNLTGINPGTNAQLVFRLVNNDGDISTSVRITNFALINAPNGTQAPVQTDFAKQISQTTTPNFNLLTDVSNSVGTEYYRTSFNADTHLLYADIALRNIGSYSVDSPLIVAVNHLSDPTVLVRNPDGFTPDGLPYYDFSKLVGDTRFDPNELTNQRSLIFYNPQGVQFTYDLTVLSQLNAAPVILTQANKEVIAGHNYSYDVDATDLNGDSLTYKLLVAPNGMTIDQTTGLIRWNTTTSNIGNSSVLVEVGDGRGGVTQQEYSLSVIDAPPNRPPVFTSTPVVDAAINTSYTYQANASDADDDGLSFSLLSAPQGMTVDANTGIVSWTPTAKQLGTYDVTLAVADARGGTAQQAFKVQTQAQPGNHAPIIISTAETTAYTATGYTYRVEALDPDRDSLTYSLATAPAGMTIDASTGQILWTTNSSNAGIYNISVKVLDAQGAKDTQNFTLNVSSNLPGQIWGRVSGDSSNLQTTSYNSQSIAQPRTGNRLPASTIPLTQVVQLPQGFYSLYGIEYYEAKEQVLVSDAGYTRTTSRLNLIQPDGTLVPFSNVTQDAGPGSYGSGITSLRSFTTVAEDNLGGFTAGDIFGNAGGVYSGFGYDPNITKITDGGATIIPRWATLPTNLNYRVLSLQIDTTGIFGGDLIVESDTGVDSRGYFTFKPTLFRVKADGTVTTLATLDSQYGGNSSFEIVPNDVARYGPLAGKIVVAHRQGFSTVDVAGNVQFIPFQGAGDIHLIRPNENLFAESNYTYIPRILYGTPASYFESMVGDFLIDNGYYSVSRMYWDGQALKIEPLNAPQMEGITFAPVGINNIAPVNPVSLADWTVYIDKNNNGRRDSDELFTKTDANGIYSFTLPVGNYTVAEELPGGWSQTLPPPNQGIQVSLSSGQTITGVDFSNTKNDTAPLENQAPHFTSFAPTQAIVDQRVVYRPSAFDPDGDVLSYDLLVKPDGMAVDPNTGIIAWRPTSEQVGTQDVIVRVRDAKGALDLQSFQIQVGSAQTPPLFTALPKPGSIAAVGVPFQFQIIARNPLLDPITFELTTNASGAVIDPTTGLLKWTPTAVGTYNFTLTANDGKGGKTTQSFQLQALANVPNDAPIITSQPLKASSLGLPYVYTIRANDPNNDPLNYSLLTAPAGMTLDNQGNLFWQPTASQVGQNSVAIKVSDGRGGEVTQSFDINIVSSATIPNHAPRITSTPVGSAVVNKLYQSELKVTDSDNDLLLVSLDKAPDGMFIDPQTSILRWTPTANQLGDASVVVRVQDSHGAFDLLSFTVNVRLVNTPPLINSTPGTQAATGKLYKYLVQASDIDTDSLTYNLVNAPDGMTVDPQSGLIQWTPASNQLGQQDITVAVNDGLGGIATQNYTIQVSATLSNFAPIINSTPIYLAAVGSAYQYQMQASDPDAGDTLTYQLISGPTDMTINSTTGLLTWLSPVSGNYKVVLEAVDNHGESATQAFTLTARENHAPVIKSNPLLTATPGSTYSYDVIASDADGDRLSYTLDQASRDLGMTLDTLGRLRWTPTAGNVGSHTVVITVNDANGGTGQQQYNLSVAADDVAPKVRLIANYDLVNLGESITFQARATDNTKVAGLQLLINGTSVVLDANGMAKFTPTQAGTITAKAYATDAAGNIGQASFNVAVIDTSDVSAPDVSLNLGAYANGTVTAPVDIKGTVSDDNLDYYTLLVAPIGSSDFREIFRGTSTVNDGVLGKFDPSLLENDSYTLRLEAHDQGGNVSFVEDTVNVSGELKLGNFRLSFTDLSIPVTGIPITLTRTYDSLTSGTTDDFGYGWRMEFRDTDLRTSVGKPTGEVAELGGQNPFKDGTKVYITLPGGKREGFTFRPAIDPLSQYLRGAGGVDSDPNIYHPSFVADAGVTDTLTVQNTRIIHGAGTNQYYGLAGSAYNPADVYFGGVYTLTTKEGIVYQIDAATGDLLTVTDTSGNTLTYTDADITSSTGQKITFGRDAQGRIATVTDPAGKQIHYGYNAQGDLVSVTDREGNTTQMEYDQERKHYLDKIIDPLGKTGVRNEYGDDGRLKKMVDAAGASVQLAYDPSHSTETITDALDHPTTYEYDDRGNVVTEIDALGGIITRDYDQDNNLLKKVDPDGVSTTYTYDSKGNPLTITDRDGNVTHITYNQYGETLNIISPTGLIVSSTYDKHGNLLSRTNTDGQTTTFSYDGFGRLIKQTAPDNEVSTYTYDDFGNPTVFTDSRGNQAIATYDLNGKVKTLSMVFPQENQTLNTSYTYDNQGRTTSVTNPQGNVTTTEYDAKGNVIATTDIKGNRTQYFYDDKGQQVKVILPDNTPNNPNDNPIVQTEYDAAGRVISQTSATGLKTRYVYDALGRLTDTILPDLTPDNPDDNPREKIEYTAADRIQAKIDIFGTRTEYTYDNLGRVSRERDFFGNSTGNDTTYTYNIDGQVTSVTDARNRTTLIGIDDKGRRSVTTYFDGTTSQVTYDALGRTKSETNQLGQTTSYDYDVFGKVAAITNPLNQQTQFTYNSRGSLVKVTDALNHSTQYEYDQYNRQTAVINANGNRTETTYDQYGQVATKKDGNQHITQYFYDNLGTLTSVKLANQATTNYTYDNLGRLTQFEDANHNKTTYEYDAFNRQVATNLPLGQRSTTTFNNFGQVANTKDFNGDVINYAYDQYGRLANKSFSNPLVATVSYTYDPVTSQVKTVTDGRGVTSYGFDSYDRVNLITNPDGRTVGYTYDVLGNLKTLTTSASTVNYSYDVLNRLDTVTSGGQLAKYGYDAVGNLISTALADGTTETRQYDASNRLKSIETRDALGTVLSSYAYTLDGVGDRTKVVEDTGRTVNYTYDEVNQLRLESITDPNLGNRTIGYDYDLVGNRLKRNDSDSSSGLTMYVYDKNNRLISQTSGTKVTQYTYDNNGSMLTNDDGTNSVVYQWINDGENRLIGMTTTNASGSSQSKYIYDADGNRVASINDGVRKNYLVDPRGYSKVLQEYDANGQVLTKYFYGLGLIKSESGSDERFYHSDGLGSTRLLTDGTGQVTDRYVYDAFGRLIAHAGGSDNAYQFAGEQRDSTGLDYLRARYYNSDLGRFISKDAFAGHLASPISENAYVYANANPVNFTDPSGYESLGELSAAEAIIGILSSMQYAITTGALAGAAFNIVRQDIQIVESGHEFDPSEVLRSAAAGAVGGALLNVFPEAAIYFAIQGIQSGLKEWEAGNRATGAFDIVASISPFLSKGVRDQVFSRISPTLSEANRGLLNWAENQAKAYAALQYDLYHNGWTDETGAVGWSGNDPQIRIEDVTTGPHGPDRPIPDLVARSIKDGKPQGRWISREAAEKAIGDANLDFDKMEMHKPYSIPIPEKAGEIIRLYDEYPPSNIPQSQRYYGDPADRAIVIRKPDGIHTYPIGPNHRNYNDIAPTL